MGNLFGSSGSSGNSGSSSLGSSGNALAGLSDTFSNLFASNAALSPDSSDLSGLFGNVSDQAFNQDTASIQATQAITPPAQAQANAAAGQDPSAGVGGAQSQAGTQTASTGPSGQSSQPSQDQQEQEQRNKAIDELRRLFKQREQQQQQPPQWNPRYAATPISPQAAIDAGLSASNISPDAAVRAGLLDPSLIDPATGAIRRDQPAPAEDPSVEPPPTDGPRLYTPGSAPTGGGGAVPPKTVPGAPGAPVSASGGVPGLPGLGLPGLGWLPLLVRGALGGAASVPFTATPAETGELQEKYWPKPPAEPEPTTDAQPMMPPRTPTPQHDPPDAPLPPPRPKDQRKLRPKAAEPPRRVWVPPTPGHYDPTPGNVRGPPTWVPGTPGHYVEAAAPGQGRPPAAVAPVADSGQRKTPEAAQRLSEARAEAPSGVMAYNEERMSPILRDILGIAMPQMLPSLARLSGQRPMRPTWTSAAGQGGTRPYNENWGGAPYAAKGDEIQRGRQYMGYLTSKGLTRQGAAALLGNAHQESNLSATLAPGGDGGTAAGMFQWRGPRQIAFRRWLQANGRSESDPQAHLDFALYEMQTNPAYRASWDALHNPNMTPAQIADIIANNYEGSLRGPTQGMNNRIGFANTMLQGGEAPVTTQATGGDARA